MLAAGDTLETILDEYPNLTPDDIQACLLFRPSVTCERFCTTSGLVTGFELNGFRFQRRPTESAEAIVRWD